MAKIVLHKRAAKYLGRMDQRIKEQVIAKLEALASNPEQYYAAHTTCTTNATASSSC